MVGSMSHVKFIYKCLYWTTISVRSTLSNHHFSFLLPSFFCTLPCALLLIIYLTIFLLGTFALFYRVGITVICFSDLFSVHSREITILFNIFAYHQMSPIPMICNLFNTCSLQNRYQRQFRGKLEAMPCQFASLFPSFSSRTSLCELFHSFRYA
jgi:hypothetical protein